MNGVTRTSRAQRTWPSTATSAAGSRSCQARCSATSRGSGIVSLSVNSTSGRRRGAPAGVAVRRQARDLALQPPHLVAALADRGVDRGRVGLGAVGDHQHLEARPPARPERRSRRGRAAARRGCRASRGRRRGGASSGAGPGGEHPVRVAAPAVEELLAAGAPSSSRRGDRSRRGWPSPSGMNSRRGGAVSSNPAASARRASPARLGFHHQGRPRPSSGRHGLAPVEQGLGQVDRVHDHGLAAADRADRARAPAPGRAGAAGGCRRRRSRTRRRRPGRGRRRCSSRRSTARARAPRARARSPRRLACARRAPRPPRPWRSPASPSARGSRMSIAITSAAPRRSISKAQKPSNVPTSRQRCPASDAGREGRRSRGGRTSPGVTHARRELERVVPLAALDLLAQLCRRHRAAHAANVATGSVAGRRYRGRDGGARALARARAG